MKAVIVGASGRIGETLVRRLRQHGVIVTAAAPTFGVNTVTGEGLRRSLEPRTTRSQHVQEVEPNDRR